MSLVASPNWYDIGYDATQVAQSETRLQTLEYRD
jgi:hypothetical protein